MKPLDPLRPGDAVYVQDPKSGRWDATGEIIKKRGRRSYVVEVEGKTGLRNRRQLRPKQDNKVDGAKLASVRPSPKRVRFRE